MKERNNIYFFLFWFLNTKKMAIKPSAMAMLKKKVVEENREGSVGSKQTEKKETQSW